MIREVQQTPDINAVFGSFILNNMLKTVRENKNDRAQNLLANTFSISHRGPMRFPKARANVKDISRHVVKKLTRQQTSQQTAKGSR